MLDTIIVVFLPLSRLNGTRIKNLEKIWHLISWEHKTLSDVGSHQTNIWCHNSEIIKFSFRLRFLTLWHTHTLFRSVSVVFIFRHYQSMKFDMFIYSCFQVTCTMNFSSCHAVHLIHAGTQSDFLSFPYYLITSTQNSFKRWQSKLYKFVIKLRAMSQDWKCFIGFPSVSISCVCVTIESKINSEN